MPNHFILGTAGHIDHGKTSLVKALTGIDCDRLPEEKDRGITIDIGFAHLDAGSFRVGVIDVPGHERFVKNMLAGATGIDLAMLVVAADDSVMPQTREHFEILKLLGIKHGVIALTKCDKVDELTREVAAMEVRELVKGSFLADAPIVATSTATGLGIEQLRAAILELCVKAESEPTREEVSALFRLSVDRCFVVQGHGTVVTGSVGSGVLRAGDELDLHSDGVTARVRVRGLNNHGVNEEEVRCGQRAAINITGVDRAAIHRGSELASPGYLHSSRLLTVVFHALPELRKPIAHRLPIRLHIGTAEVTGSISLLGTLDSMPCASAAPGTACFAQLFLESPVVAFWRQPFVLRSSSAEQTIGGGQILQPTPTRHRRANHGVLEHLHQLLHGSAAERVGAAVWFAGLAGMELGNLPRETGVHPDRVEACIEERESQMHLQWIALPANRRLLVHAEHLGNLKEQLLEILGEMHDENPLLPGLNRPQVLARFDYVGDSALLDWISDRLIHEGKIRSENGRIWRADFKPRLTANQRKLKERIVAAHAAGGFQPPDMKSFEPQAGGNAASLNEIYDVAVAEGSLVRIAEGIYFHADVEDQMRRQVEERLAIGPASVADIRDLLGTTRKYAIPICEYLDHIGCTRREGDKRVRAGSG